MPDPTPLAPPEGFEPFIVYGKKHLLEGFVGIKHAGYDKAVTLVEEAYARPALRGTVRELAQEARRKWNEKPYVSALCDDDWQAVVRLLAGAQVTDADGARVAELERDLAKAREERDDARAELAMLREPVDFTDGEIFACTPGNTFSFEIAGHWNDALPILRRIANAAAAKARAGRDKEWLLHCDRVLGAAYRAGKINSWLLHILDDLLKYKIGKLPRDVGSLFFKKDANPMPSTATASAGGCSTGGDSRPVRIVSTCAAPTVADCELAEQAALDAYTRAGGTVTDRKRAVVDGLRNRYMSAVLATDEARVRATKGE